MKYNNFILVLGIFTLLVTACGKSDSPEYYELNLDNLRSQGPAGEILPAENEAYGLSNQEIEKVEAILKERIDVFNSRSGLDSVYLEEYGRQYVGSKSPNDEIIVYVNCFCKPEDWENKDEKLVIGLDGGLCYFRLKINLTTGKVFDFITNGVA